MYIYKITNNINGRMYIGSKKGSVEETQDYYGSGTVIKHAINKYGIENFTKEIICKVESMEELKELEQFILTETDCANNPLYYNCHNNYSGGFIPEAYTQESRNKIGIANSKRVLSDYQRSCVWMNTPEVNKKKHPKATCRYCGKEANLANITRWHNDNCKHRVESNVSI